MEMEGIRSQSPEGLAQTCLQCYVKNDRETLEKIIAEDFTFTSPLDNHIARTTYFERCWPNSQAITNFEIVRLVPARDSVFVTYIGTKKDGRKFRNTEFFSTRNGQITSVEVYFGWNLPHAAKEGEFTNGA